MGQLGTRPLLRCQEKFLLSMPIPERISKLPYVVLPRVELLPTLTYSISACWTAGVVRATPSLGVATSSLTGWRASSKKGTGGLLARKRWILPEADFTFGP